MSVTAIVLAGGRSTRFGGQKLAAELEGASLLEHAIRAVAAVGGEVLVAGPVDTRLPRDVTARVRIIPDAEAFGGPLAALAGALHAATGELALVAGGDMPGLAAAVLRSMFDRLASSPDVDGVILEAPAPPGPPGKRQVLPLALRIAAASPAADATLASGDRSLAAFLTRLRIDAIPAAEWLALDPAGTTLFDVDVPDDLARWRAGGRGTAG